MRYLGVLVEQGGVTVSRLDRGGGGEVPPAPIDPPAKVKAVRKKKAVTAV